MLQHFTRLTFISDKIFENILYYNDLFQDINNLHDEVMVEMDEFKIMANDAWLSMITIQKPADANFNPFIVQRKKRQAAECNCAAKAQNCPDGPPGSPGTPGVPGEDGFPGENGKAGASSVLLANDNVKSGCILVC